MGLQKKLSIAIPTYNRAKLLDICLNSIFSQITFDIKDDIEVIVSDNCCTDNTSDIINNYCKKNHTIKYLKNETNLGPDRNIASCFSSSNSEYVWILSDDDFIMPGYLKLIVGLLQKGDIANVFLKQKWYKINNLELNIAKDSLNYTTCLSHIDFIEKVNYWITFISGNIVNKNLVIKNLDGSISDLYDTYLVQLAWMFPAIFSGKKNIIVNDQAIACLADNTGGYKLVEVFGYNFNKIMKAFIKKKLFDNKVKDVINISLLSDFFPMFLNTAKMKSEKRNVLIVMIKTFWYYPKFWSSIFLKLL